MLFLLTLIICSMLVNTLYSAEVLDRIIAVVDKEVILYSELQEQLAYVLYFQEVPESEIPKLEEEILIQMLEAKILVVMAEKEDIIISEDEINYAIDNTIERLRSNYPTEEAFQRALLEQGLTEEEIRESYRPEIKEELSRMYLINKKIRSQIEILPEDVEEFYESIKDTLPSQAGMIRLNYFFLPIELSQESKREVEKRAMELRERILAGENFAELARNYSEWPNAKQDGYLGCIRKGDFKNNEFEQAAFSLEEEGEISEIIKTKYAYQIIRLEKKEDDKICLSNIALTFNPTIEDTQNTYLKMQSILSDIEAGENIETLEAKYPNIIQDDIGYFETDKATPLDNANYSLELEDIIQTESFIEEITSMQENEISIILLGKNGYYFFQATEKTEEHKLTFNEIKEYLEQALMEEKTQEKYYEWLEEAKQGLYIEILL